MCLGYDILSFIAKINNVLVSNSVDFNEFLGIQTLFLHPEGPSKCASQIKNHWSLAWSFLSPTIEFFHWVMEEKGYLSISAWIGDINEVNFASGQEIFYSSFKDFGNFCL